MIPSVTVLQIYEDFDVSGTFSAQAHTVYKNQQIISHLQYRCLDMDIPLTKAFIFII
jgi:hypothetical protein